MDDGEYRLVTVTVTLIRRRFCNAPDLPVGGPLVALAGAASCVEVAPRSSPSEGLAGLVALCLSDKYAPNLSTAGNPAAGATPGGPPAGNDVATAGNPAAGASPGGPPAGTAVDGDCIATSNVQFLVNVVLLPAGPRAGLFLDILFEWARDGRIVHGKAFSVADVDAARRCCGLLR